MKLQKVIVAVGLESDTDAPLLQIRDLEFPQEAEVIFVHVIPLILYARGLSLELLTYPTIDERPGIEASILMKLNRLKLEVLPPEQKGRECCLFGSNTRSTFVDFVIAEKPDLVVVATRGRHGIMNFFDSSFAQYLIKYCPSKILILR